MTDLTGFDRTLSDWLDDMGAQDAPPHLAVAAIERARRTRRSRSLPDFLKRWPFMSTYFPAAGALPLGRPVQLARIVVALVFLALALIGAALLAVGTRPSPL